MRRTIYKLSVDSNVNLAIGERYSILKKDFLLQTISIEITNFCFLECSHCSSEASHGKEEILPFEIIKKMLFEFKELGGVRVEISGGEPLCHPNIAEIIKCSKSLGLETCLFSCGISDISQLNSDKGIQEKAKELKSLGIDKVFVSLHGSNEEYHNQISQRSTFKQTTRFIQELLKEGIYVGVHFVPVQLNFDNIDDLIDYCLKLGVNEIGVLRFVAQGRGKSSQDVLKLSSEQILHLTYLLSQEINKESIVRLGSHLDFCFFYIRGHDPHPCSAGISKCLVTSKGQVIPCAVFKGLDNFVAGNIHSNDLGDIWKGSKVFDDLRNFDPRKLQGRCSTCGYLLKCKGRCPAQRYYEQKDIYIGPDSYCPLDAREKQSKWIS